MREGVKEHDIKFFFIGVKDHDIHIKPESYKLKLLRELVV